jgi:hypothetical protein
MCACTQACSQNQTAALGWNRCVTEALKLEECTETDHSMELKPAAICDNDIIE